MENLRNILVIGLDVSTIASSAKNGGYNPFSVDYFGDLDLRDSCVQSVSKITQKENISCGWLNSGFNPKDFLIMTKKILHKYEIGGILLSSGLEDHPQTLYALNKLAPIIGNSPTSISRVRDKKRFFVELNRIEVSHPDTELVKDFEDAKAKARDIGYPLIVKPEKGFGGSGLRKVSDSKSFEKIFYSSQCGEKILIQKFINGKAASASVLSTKSKALALTVNEQILGERKLGQQEPFGYCGNIVPLDMSNEVSEKCKNIAEKVIRHYNLIGSNGVDFMITKDGTPYVVEVNPRFQGSLECVERTLGINLVRAHIEACIKGNLPKIGEANSFCVRFILYALRRSKVPALSKFKGVRDIPFQGVIVERGEPLCSIFTKSYNRTIALQKAWKRVDDIYRYIYDKNHQILGGL